MPSEYEKRIREEELRRLAEEYDWLQQNQERADIDVEELKRQEDMKEGDFLQDPEAPYDFNQAMQIGQYFASQGSPSFDVNPNKKPLTEREKQRQDKLRKRAGSGQQGADIAKKKLPPEALTDLPNFLQSAQMDEIYRRDKEENREFDEAVSGGTLEDLREGVKIRKREGLNLDPSIIGDVAEAYSDAKATHIASMIGGSILGEYTILPEGTGALVGGALGYTLNQIRKQVFGQVTNAATDYMGMALKGVDGGEFVLKAGGPFDTINKRASWKQFINQMSNADDLPSNRSGITGSGGGLSQGFSHVPPNPSEIYKVNQKLLNSSLLGPGQKFNYAAFRALLESDRGRTISVLFQTTPHAKIPNWAAHRKSLVDVFEGMYGDVMSKLKISRSDIDIDHLFTLQQSMPIYDNVAYGSDLWNSLQRTMLNRKYQPGNTIANLNALDPGTHKVKTAFFNKLHGKNGERFFTRKRMKAIQNDPVKRMELLNKYLDEQDKGRKILENGQKVWETLYKPGTIMPDDLVEALADIPLDEFSHPTLKGIIKEIVEDEAARYALRVSEGREALLEAIKTGKTPRVTKKNNLPTQKQIDKAIKEAGTSYQPTLDPTDPSLNP